MAEEGRNGSTQPASGAGNSVTRNASGADPRLESGEPAELPVAVIGAGPVGLAAAAHLLERGIEPLVLEAGDRVGTSVRQWGFVRLFSPWSCLVDGAASRLLAASGWQPPAGNEHPTGDQLVERYLEPLAAQPKLSQRIQFNSEVVSVTRDGYDLMKSPGREAAPFLLVVDTSWGEVRYLARAVIDASGTWHKPNPLGPGTPAQGETGAAHRIRYGIPDATGVERDRYAGRRTLVVGAGHSAMNAVIDLARVREVDGGEVIWAIRSEARERIEGGGDADELPRRAELGEVARRLVQDGQIELLTRFRPESLTARADHVEVRSRDGRSILAHEVVAATGFRPDLEMTRELRLSLDPAVEAPTALAPLIDPNVHSCGTVPPHGEAELAHPESGYYLVGMKSYGRAPTFLMLTGYEQVRSIAASLAGDLEGARSVELVLPDTGVCSSEPTIARSSGARDSSRGAVQVLAHGGRAEALAGSGGCCES